MTKERPPFRLLPEQQLEQMRVLVAAQEFTIPIISKMTAIAKLASGEAKLDLKRRRLIVSFDISDSLGS